MRHLCAFFLVIGVWGALATSSSGAQAQESPSLNNFPSPERVMRDVVARADGADEVTVAGRQFGRILLLAGIIQNQQAALHQNDPDKWPGNARRKYRSYIRSAVEIRQNLRNGTLCRREGLPDNCEDLFYNGADLYADDPIYVSEAAELYFPAEQRRSFLSLSQRHYSTVNGRPVDAAALLREAMDREMLRQASQPFVNTAWFIALFAIATIALAVFLFFRRIARRKAQFVQGNIVVSQQWEKSNNRFMEQFRGSDKNSRAQEINKIFDEKIKSIDLSLDYARYQQGGGKTIIKCDMSRPLASMPPREREALRSTILLRNEGLHHSEYNTWSQILGILFGDKKAVIFEGGTYIRTLQDGEGVSGDLFPDDVRTPAEKVAWIIGDDGVEASVSLALRELTRAVEKAPDNPVIQNLAARLLGDGGDLGAATGTLHPITDISHTDGALIVGQDERDPSRLMAFAGQGSLITVAPPGSGKTQCHVIPNLLTWTGPAVVLDIKGEIYAATSGWREANVGPVYRFDPLNPGRSHSYNPLLTVSDDPDHIWEDSRFLADMLMVPGGKAKDPFWESRARDVLTAAIAATVRDNSSEERSMGKVLDILHGVGWPGFIMTLKVATDVPTMVRAASSLGEMDTKMRDSVLQTALASLSAWEGGRITRATSKSDWTPADLRSGKNPTIYICIAPNQIDSYASMLRVIIAQHIRSLTSTLPDQKDHPILFILDELPRLRHMPPVEEALEIGRQYGIKLWMFTQSLGQLENAYENAEGMVGSCAVRMFMNPSLHDETAQKLSDDMGYRESVIDGTRVKRMEANVLAGPEFADKVIVLASSAEPARVRKHFAHADPEFSSRMQMPPAGAKE